MLFGADHAGVAAVEYAPAVERPKVSPRRSPSAAESAMVEMTTHGGWLITPNGKTAREERQGVAAQEEAFLPKH